MLDKVYEAAVTADAHRGWVPLSLLTDGFWDKTAAEEAIDDWIALGIFRVKHLIRFRADIAEHLLAEYDEQAEEERPLQTDADINMSD